VKFTAIRALGEIGDSSLTPVLLDALGDRSSSAKWMAMRALEKHGDESAIPAVTERTKAIVSKPRKYGQEHKSELEAAIEFLNRFAAQKPEIRVLFDQIKTNRWQNVFPDEQRWLKENIPAFADTRVSEG
jgi:HEAT repeat protein